MKLAETCVKYPVFTVMLIAFLVTLGVFSYRGLAVDLFPKADPATVNVEVRLPGATPEEVVTGVVLPLEDAISSVSGIDEINVWSFEGFADITCTFVLERDIEGAAQDIREKVAGAIDRLPRDTLPPIITKQDPQSDPIMTLLVSGPMSRRELTEIADKQIRRAIQTADGVGSVDLNGGQGRQVRVLLDAQKLTAHNFAVLDVRSALQRENIEAPGGRMITGPQELGLRTLGRVTSAEQFGEIVIGTRGGTPVRVRDVAQVEDGAQELRTWSALFRKRLSGQDVVSIQALRQSGVNTVRVIDDAIIVLENIFRFMEEKGRDRVRASIEATKEIGLAVMATTLSLVIIFLPIAFMTGYARKYVNSFGWTMAMAILVSLLVAFTLTPMMSSRLLKLTGSETKSRSLGFLHRVEERYLAMLRWSLDHRPAILLTCVSTFLSTFGFYRLVGRDWIPADDQSELISSFTLPEGTSLEKTTQTAKSIAEKVAAFPEVAFVQSFTHGPTNHAHLFIGLVPRSERKKTHAQLATTVRGVLAGYRNMTYNG